MRMKSSWFVVVGTCAVLTVGCAGDVGKTLTTNPETQARVMDTIAGNGYLAAQVTDRMLGVDSTRTIVVDKLLANGPAVQEIMARMARDPSMVDGIVNVAVQDTAMRAHVMTLFRGMQMMEAR